MCAIASEDLSRHFTELSLKIYDSRAMLSAIEAMLFESSGRKIEAHLINSGAAEVANDVHYLVSIAIERARQAIALSDEFESLLLQSRLTTANQNEATP